MCHTIRMNDSYTYIPLGERRGRQAMFFLIGAKNMSYNQAMGRFYAPYQTSSYYQTTKHRLGVRFTCQDAVRSQPLKFAFGRAHVIYRGKVRAGMHISPLLPSATIDLLLSVSSYLVAFRTQDVVFFDGIDASVRRFLVLNPAAIVPKAFLWGECPWSLEYIMDRLQETWKRVKAKEERKGEQE